MSHYLGGVPVIAATARRNQGLEELKQAIAHLVSAQNFPPAKNDPVRYSSLTEIEVAPGVM
jgi:Fe2+ transport system protein B